MYSLTTYAIISRFRRMILSTLLLLALGVSFSLLAQDGKPIYQINCGGPAVGSFAKDAYFEGGSIFDVSTVVSIDAGDVNQAPPTQVLRSQRYGNFSYSFPGLVPNRHYLVRLHFAEMYFNNQQVGKRVFNVSINRKVALDHFDILVAAGGKNRAIVKEFNVEADTNGMIRIVFDTVVPFATVNAIEIIQGPGGVSLLSAADAPSTGKPTAGSLPVVPNQNASSNTTAANAAKPSTNPTNTSNDAAKQTNAPLSAQEDNARDARLSEIAFALQDPKSNTAALLTEAARLCGFAIWKEDRTPVAPPIGPPLHLAVTDNEIESFAAMYRSHQSVSLSDLINSIDYSYKKINPGGSVRPNVLKWLNDGDISENPSVRALVSFLKDMHLFRSIGKADGFTDPNVQLDPIQALFILRVVTEEIAAPIRKAISKRQGNQNLKGKTGSTAFVPASYWNRPSPFECYGEGYGWAEDAYVGGALGVYEQIAARAGEAGEMFNTGTGLVNTLSSLVKFITTYQFLKHDIELEGGPPLIRTKDEKPGVGSRTIVAKFSIDGTKVTDWLKEHRCMLALLRVPIDLDFQKTAPLSGVETSWRAGQSTDPKKQIIWVAPGQGDPEKILTNEDGEARLKWWGASQQVVLDPKKVTPWDRIVGITVTPQVKRPEIKQDIVDALLGVLGVNGGLGVGIPIYEQLYRLKWNGSAYLPLRVRDWEQAETIGGMTIFLKASAHDYRKDSAYQISFDRTLDFKDVAMQVVGADLPEPDPDELAKMDPLKRQQTEAAINAAKEAAKKRSFVAIGPGKVSMTVNDNSFRRNAADECGDISESERTVTVTGPPSGSKEQEFGPPPDVLPWMTNFTVEVDVEKKIAIIKGDYALQVKITTVTTEDKKTTTVNSDGRRTIFHGLVPSAPFDPVNGITVPLTEEPIADDLAALGWTGYSYSGKVTIPFTFDRGKYNGNAYLSFYIKRVSSKKQ